MRIVKFTSNRTSDLVNMNAKEREFIAYVLRYYAGECHDRDERERAKRYARQLTKEEQRG